MGLLDGVTHQQYYQGNDFGNYQFTSLENIINQFLVAYTGEEKIINKVSRTDVAFHAQRAMQELSFDTFKSIKSQQIDLPPSNVMILPHDYVNYTKVLWTDSSGIKHPIYPTKDTQNPFQIKQNEGDGSYSFPSGVELLTNEGFDNVTGDYPDDWNILAASDNFQANYQSSLGIISNKLTWSYVTKNGHGSTGWGHIGAIYQQVDVSDLSYIDISADGVVADIAYTNASATTGTATSTIRLGITTVDPLISNPDGNLNNHPTYVHPGNTSGSIPPGTVFPQSPFSSVDIFDIDYVEWTGTENSTKTIDDIDVTNIDTIYILALSFIDVSEPLDNGFALKPSGGSTPVNGTITGDGNINTLDNLSIVNTHASVSLSATIGNEKNSSTWNNYKSNSSNESTDPEIYNYDTDIYDFNVGERYGLDPQHAQVNGSFFIDHRLGRIHFSSNMSGRTIILDYISDSLGTDGEMQVHKFAEEAMYKWIIYAILSTRINVPEYIVQRYKKEKFAAVRQAKLRLSNIKLEELTQILRGKSKHIKH